jgi:hypothetical protein
MGPAALNKPRNRSWLKFCIPRNNRIRIGYEPSAKLSAIPPISVEKRVDVAPCELACTATKTVDGALNYYSKFDNLRMAPWHTIWGEHPIDKMAADKRK